MANYKPIKITFDLDDEHQLKLYNYLKKRSNGSSFIRTLLYQDINKNLVEVDQSEQAEQAINLPDSTSTTESKVSIPPIATVRTTQVNKRPAKVNISQPKITIHEDDEIVLDGLL